MVKPKPSWKRRLRLYFVSNMPRRKRMKGGILHRILGDGIFDKRLWKPERLGFARGLAVGLIVGLLPTYYFQALLAFFLAYVLRLNVTASVLGTLVTNPLTTPFILVLQYRLGVWLIGAPSPEDHAHLPAALRAIFGHGKPYVAGSVVSALLIGILGYFLSLLIWDIVARMRSRSRAAHAG